MYVMKCSSKNVLIRQMKEWQKHLTKILKLITYILKF